MIDVQWLIMGMAIGTFTIRVAGTMAGGLIARSKPLARVLETLPGCLIIALVAVAVMEGGLNALIAAMAATMVAILSQSLVATMIVGMGVAAMLANI